MATISTIAADASYEVLAGELSYTLVRCEARPLTAALAPPFAALLAESYAISADERKLDLAVLRAEILVILADEDLDRTVDSLVHAVLGITGGKRTHELYLHYFDGITPAELKAPVLDEELETVREWISPLAKSPYPALTALAPVFTQQVAAADKAVAALAAAKQALKEFRDLGPRRALVDKINARRKATHGELGEISHSNPQLHLPKDYADLFFLHAPRSRRRITSRELTEKRDALAAQVEGLSQDLAATTAEEEAREAKKAGRREKTRQKKIAAAEKKAAQAAAELAALKSGG